MTEHATDQDRTARIALAWAAGPGNRAVWAMVQADGAPVTLGRLLDGDIPEAGLRESIARKIAVDGDPRRHAESAMRRAGHSGMRLVVPGDDEWPAQLFDLDRVHPGGAASAAGQGQAPPLGLWVRGRASLRETVHRSVAVVGARAATAYGTQIAADLARGLAEQGWTVVSGGAYGIDAAAHRSALTANGRTVAVLACGLDRLYPSGNAALLEHVADTGLLISEWPPGSEPLRHRFLARNRIVAALSAGTVLVEAAPRSGSIHMIGQALALRRPALVVPGPVTSTLSAGCHEVLRAYPEATLVADSAQMIRAVERPADQHTTALPGPDRRSHRAYGSA